MSEVIWRSRGYLPHIDAPNLVQHVVFRLADSLPFQLPKEIVKTPRSGRVEAADKALDQGHGRCDLRIFKIGNLVEQGLLRFDTERYRLIAWCVMPNHVHVLLETKAGHGHDKVVHSWKSFTAHAANRLLGRQGTFWAPEYFDRYMRDAAHFRATVTYIEGNPVKAGLCKDSVEWPFSSAALR